tara:strand:+ start:347 stop:505 length:159 start_codon:yes stop_codon:yes gene_type:complete
MKQPDPKKHFQISITKSMLRILAACCLMLGLNIIAGFGFAAAEILGIWEEMV